VPVVLRFASVDVVRGEAPVLHGVDWTVRDGERWAVLGPNGSGKTTMMQLASGYLHPTRGVVEVLGRRLGRVDVRQLRERLGIVSAAVARMLLPNISAQDVVLSSRYAALEPWWHEYSDEDRATALKLLADAGFASVAGRPFGVLSEGERQQVLLARTLMAEPELILLDEPAAGLDVAGRERLVTRLSQLAADREAPPMVLVTHHVEEIPAHFSHVLLLRNGQVVTAGPIGEALSFGVAHGLLWASARPDGAGRAVYLPGCLGFFAVSWALQGPFWLFGALGSGSGDFLQLFELVEPVDDLFAPVQVPLEGLGQPALNFPANRTVRNDAPQVEQAVLYSGCGQRHLVSQLGRPSLDGCLH
jgi:iron complex transport system ATP-binding protein